MRDCIPKIVECVEIRSNGLGNVSETAEQLKFLKQINFIKHEMLE